MTVSRGDPPIKAESRRLCADAGRMDAWLDALEFEEAGCVEVRILNANLDLRSGLIGPHPQWKATFGGYFDDRAKLKAAVAKVRGVSVHVSLNPLNPDLLARAHNRLRKLGTGDGTSDKDATGWRWLYSDFDPERLSDISATDEELAEAVARSTRFLAENPDLAAASHYGVSGNGALVITRLPDYPNDAEHHALIVKATALLSARYTDARVKLDTQTTNIARIGPMIGTWKCKGDDVPRRPWRLGWLDSPPGRREPFDLVDWVARNAPPEPEAPAADPAPEPRPRTSRTGRAPDAVERAGLYLDRIDPAIAGRKGHNAAFKAACRVGPGFDLPHDVAVRLLSDRYNPRCEPPWSEKELRHKVEDAYKVEDRRGWLLDADRHGTAHVHRNGHAHRPVEDAPDGEPSDDDLGLTRGDKVAPENVVWLWHYRLARSSMALLAGDGGLGKSQAMLAVAAAVTTGGPWPDGSGNAPLGSVVILSAEDRPADTIAPRLIALGADMSKVVFARARKVIRRPGQEPLICTTDFQDIEHWQEVFDRVPDCVLFIVDPLPGYLGKNVNDNRNNEVRAVMEPFIQQVIEPRGICMYCNSHLNKSTDARTALARITGSVAYVNIARNVHLIARDPEDEGRCFYGQPKCNNAPANLPYMAFRVERVEIEGAGGEVIETAIPRFEDEVVTIDINEVVNHKPGRAARGEGAGERGSEPVKTRKFVDWLVDQLGRGPARVHQLVKDAQAAELMPRPKDEADRPSISPLYNAKDRIPDFYPESTVEEYELPDERAQLRRKWKYWKLEVKAAPEPGADPWAEDEPEDEPGVDSRPF